MSFLNLVIAGVLKLNKKHLTLINNLIYSNECLFVCSFVFYRIKTTGPYSIKVRFFEAQEESIASFFKKTVDVFRSRFKTFKIHDLSYTQKDLNNHNFFPCKAG